MSELVLGNSRRREVADALGMSFGRSRALRRLARRPMSMRELADALGIDPPNATVVVDDLEAQGLVRRRRAPDRPAREGRRGDAQGQGAGAARRRDPRHPAAGAQRARRRGPRGAPAHPRARPGAGVGQAVQASSTGSPSAPWCAPNASHSSPSGPASNARATRGATRIASSGRTSASSSSSLILAAAGEDHVDLLGLDVAVGERAAHAGPEPEVGHAGLLRAERGPRHPGLPALAEPVRGRGVLDVEQVDVRVRGQSRSNVAGSSSPPK